jgi:hypothetical protein
MLFTENLESITLEDIKQFCRIEAPRDEREKEGTKVDYKEKFPDDLAKYITGFANTLGGIIIIGIKERNGIPRATPQWQSALCVLINSILPENSWCCDHPRDPWSGCRVQADW